ncbi:MAG: hypothetical protein ACLRPV_12325 [Lacrimispora saccharolytica]
MEETREMEQEIQQESDSFDTGLLERMNRIYEEREREYQKFYDQIRSREEELERIGTTLAVQKEEQEKKEAHLQEFEQSLKVIQERLEQRTEPVETGRRGPGTAYRRTTGPAGKRVSEIEAKQGECGNQAADRDQ